LGDQLSRYLDLLSARQRLVGANLANLDTPGYRTKDIDFHFEFMSATSPAAPNVIQPEGLLVKNDGNDVNLNRETRLLAENVLRFNAASTLLKGEMRLIRHAIGEGRSG
jgi:flagellar basal-body rod protein FlgB